MNDDLVNALKVVLADHYSLYFKAHGHHWNVEGDDFKQYHSFFSDIYDDAFGAIDTIAENIRKLGSYAPFKMSKFLGLTSIEEAEVGSDPDSMMMDLLMAVNNAIISTSVAFVLATESNEAGIANDLADRDGMLKKWRWQLTASLR